MKKPYLILAIALAAGMIGAAPENRPATPFESAAPLSPASPIDRLVFARLKQLDIGPAALCSDAVFVRRVYLDVIGTLPTAQEARDFLQDTRQNKREQLIDQLLDRDEFADYWALKWSNLLRIKSEFPINLWPKAAEMYHRWIRTSIRQNKPYDKFVREMITASGSNFLVPEVNFFRAVQSKEPLALAQAVALTFMGMRAENWSKEWMAGMAGFYSKVGYKSTGEWKEEIVFFDPNKADGATSAILPNGVKVQLPPDRDPRELFADWLISPKNPWFSRNIVNRIWCWLLGRGIIHDPDDIRKDNPPANPELLAYLEKELVAEKFNLKHIFRLILNSQTYQLSSIPRSKKPEAAVNFAFYPLRRLEAEVLIDALCQVTGTTETYSSLIPEPFTFIPENKRSIAIADGSITSSFLETFGRPSRDTGLESERNNRPTAAQRLHMLNSSHVNQKITQGPKVQGLLAAKKNPKELVSEIYLTILSRFPTEEELKAIGVYDRAGGRFKGREAVIDLFWALVNSDEFLYRH